MKLFGAKAERDVFAPYDELLADEEFWQEFEEELGAALTERFVNIYLAGADAALRIKPRKKGLGLKYSEDQERDEQGRFTAGGDGGGGGSGWSNVGGIEPRVFATRNDISQRSTWGGAKEWVWNDRPGMLLQGDPIDKEDLPDRLYHVTTASDKVESSGMLMGAHGGGGLGGGTQDGVSFTSNRDDARVIQRDLTRSVQIARGDAKIGALHQWASEDERTAGIPKGTLQEAADQAHEWYQHNIDAHPDSDKPSLVKDAFNQYLWGRDFASREIDDGGRAATMLKNPILFGNQEQLARLDPDQIRTLSVPTANIPDSALITSGSDDFLHEVRVYSDVPVGGTRVEKALVALKYSEDQERDEQGRFSGGGGGGGGGSTGARGRISYSGVVGGSQRIQADVAPLYEKWTASLTAEEKQAIGDYTEASTAFNNYARYNHIDEERDPALVYEGIRQLDSALAKAETPAEMVTYRGIEKGVVRSLRVGDEFVDHGYTSTSLNSHLASGFADRDSELDENGKPDVYRVVARITMPEGTHAALVNAIDSVQHDEAEVLTARDTKFRLTKINRPEDVTYPRENKYDQEEYGNAVDRVRYYDMEVVQ